MDLISILMPVKNAAPYLKSCLDSIINQSFQNWELLAVNDGSTDATWDILTNAAQSDQRIQVFQNPGSGIIHALRHAYSLSSGEFITRMDADDLMLPQKLERMIKLLNQYGEGHLILGKVQYFAKNGVGNGYLKYADWLNKLMENNSSFSDIYKECVVPSPSWMLSKKDLDICGAFSAERYPEDYDLCFRFYQHKLIVKSPPDVLHLWRDYPERTSRNDPNYQDNRFLNLKLYYFLKLDYTDKKQLILWGAGKKGKFIAQHLIDQKIPFKWVCNNENKIGRTVYGVKMESDELVLKSSNPQIILAIAGQEQSRLKNSLKTSNYKLGSDYFFFC